LFFFKKKKKKKKKKSTVGELNANPKSPIFKNPSFEIKIFPGLISK